MRLSSWRVLTDDTRETAQGNRQAYPIRARSYLSNSAFNGKTPLALRLAFQRLHFLSWQERVLLLENIHDMEDFLALGLAELESFLYRSMHARPLDMGKIWEQAERDINILGRLGARFVCVVDKDYPPLLREIHRAPIWSFCARRDKGSKSSIGDNGGDKKSDIERALYCTTSGKRNS